eukprot:12169854-Karenia_brevis.AAC.1
MVQDVVACQLRPIWNQDCQTKWPIGNQICRHVKCRYKYNEYICGRVGGVSNSSQQADKLGTWYDSSTVQQYQPP